jgi:hypothetical protein
MPSDPCNTLRRSNLAGSVEYRGKARNPGRWYATGAFEMRKQVDQ